MKESRLEIKGDSFLLTSKRLYRIEVIIGLSMS
jgi:hypothetical protein